MPLQSPSSNKKLQPLDSKNLQQTDEILNSILPPRLNLYLDFFKSFPNKFTLTSFVQRMDRGYSIVGSTCI